MIPQSMSLVTILIIASIFPLMASVRMKSTAATTIAWFRNDLRIHDNILLHEAKESVKQGNSVLCVYCFDPRHFARTPFQSVKCDRFRAKFLIESVANLRQNLRSIQSDLLVAYGKPEDIMPDLLLQLAAEQTTSATTVLVQAENAYEEKGVEKKVRKSLETRAGSQLRVLPSGATLHHLEDLPYRRLEEMSDVFTPHLKLVEQKCSIRALLPDPATGALGPPPSSITQSARCSFSYLPSLEELYEPSIQSASSPVATAATATTQSETGKGTPQAPPLGVLDFKGGESEALRRLSDWMWRDDNLKNYFEIRNGMLGERYSSKLSPWLSLGCISPRFVVAEARRYEAERVANKSTYWLVWEMCCRDFSHFLCYKYGSRVFLLGGARGVHRQWSRDEEKLNRWKDGMTGVPIVDANMRELKQTGWMSNRGRQIVASYFIFELGLDWRLGADHFESLLIDHDVYSNWGNWNAMAGLTGGRINRFNMSKQTRDYDPKGEYLRHWLPELRLMSVPYIFEPWMAPAAELARCGVVVANSAAVTSGLTPYPSPIATTPHISTFSTDRKDGAPSSGRAGPNTGGAHTKPNRGQQRDEAKDQRRAHRAQNISALDDIDGADSGRPLDGETGKSRRRGNKVQHF